MSELLKKSRENQQASLLLWSVNKWYAPSIHAAYYSCIQLMIHVIMVAGKKSYETIEKEIREFMNNPLTKGGSHVYYIGQIKQLLKNGGKIEKIKDFSVISSLKDYREKSDYKPIEIIEDDCKNANSISEKLYNFLKTEFKV